MLSKKFKTPVQDFPRGVKTIFNDRFITVKANENGLKHIRLGVLVNKHVAASAVKRNYLRRQFFSYLEKSIRDKVSKKGIDLLIITKTPIMALTREELKVSLKNYGEFIQHSSI